MTTQCTKPLAGGFIDDHSVTEPLAGGSISVDDHSVYTEPLAGGSIDDHSVY